MEIDHSNKEKLSFDFPNSPELIDYPYPYVAVGDIEDVIKRLSPKFSLKVIDGLQSDFFKIQKKFTPKEFTYCTVYAAQINKKIEDRVNEELLVKNGNIGFVHMDRYICANDHRDEFFRLEISREANSGLISRPGSNVPPDKQIENLTEWVKSNNFDQLIFIDDVLAYADTLIPIISDIQHKTNDMQIRVLVGMASSGEKWSGIEKVAEKTGILAEYITLIKASPETDWSTGMSISCSRDFTLFGGRISLHEKTQMLTSHPYIFPFSLPKKALLAGDPRLESTSHFFEFSKKIVFLIEEVNGNKLTIQDLVNNGFGVPYTSIDSLKNLFPFPSRADRLIDYLDVCRFVFDQNMEVIENELLKNKS